MLCGGDEWGRTQTATTTSIVRTTISVGLTGSVTKSRMSFLSSPEIDTAPKRTSGFSSPEVPKRSSHPRLEIRDVMWFNPGGNQMTEEEWTSPFVRCLGMLLSGDAIDVLNFDGVSVHDDTFLLLIKRALRAHRLCLTWSGTSRMAIGFSTRATTPVCGGAEKICLR